MPSTFTPATLGSRLREARIDAGLSQVELASRARVGERTIRRYEHGGGFPTVLTTARITRALGVTLDSVLR